LNNQIDLPGISVRLKQIRHKLSLTPNQIFQKTGISTGNLSELENGKYPPSAKTLVLLSELYDVSIDWILKGVASNPKNESNFEKLLLSLNQEMARFFKKLAVMWSNGDRDTQGWIMVQLRLAFPKIAAEIRNEDENGRQKIE